jgi:Kef-type K+ transport system membrane component KefB
LKYLNVCSLSDISFSNMHLDIIGSPVLGYLAAGVLIGPYGLSIIRHVHGTKAIAEFGVVFLLFNIGLELSVERLSSMKKYVFGLGSAQVLATTAAVGMIAHRFAVLPGPAAIVIGSGLALSSTAVVLQVLITGIYLVS